MKTLKKALLIILAMTCIISAFPGTVIMADDALSGVQGDGDGWIKITDAQGFIDIQNDPDGYYYLANDIDFSTYDNGSPLKTAGLVPEFSGILDGNGWAIYGFELVASESDANVGVFQTAASSAAPVIKDLSIGTAEKPIKAEVNVTGEVNFGFIVGDCVSDSYRKVTVKNVKIYGDCEIKAAGDAIRAGVVLGRQPNFVLDNVDASNAAVRVLDTVSGSSSVSVGGLVGTVPSIASSGSSLAKNCKAGAVFSADASTSTARYFGGFVGYCQDSLLIRDSEAKAVSVSQGTAYGSMIGFKRSLTEMVVVKDCVTASPDGAAMVGTFHGDGHSQYFYAYNSESKKGTENVTEIATWTELKKAFDDEAASDNIISGNYRLTNNIEITETFTSYVFAYDFAGTFDGNGFSITGFSITNEGIESSASGGTGFFASVGAKGGAVVLDLTLGANGKEISVKSLCNGASGTNNKGLLCAVTGTDSSSGAIVSEVVAYGSMELLNTGAHMGLIGIAKGATTIDACDMHGSVIAKEVSSGNTNISGIVGDIEQNGMYITDCNNFASIRTDVNAKKRLAGLVAYITKEIVIIGSNNFGEILCEGSENASFYAGGLVGLVNKASYIRAVDCINLGDVTATLGTASGLVTSGSVVAINDCYQLGTVTGSDYFDDWGPSTGTFKYGCKSSAVTMVNGASVRLAKPAGIRFRAFCDTKVLNLLEEVFGQDSISYGTIIAPEEYVKGTSFTHDALDQYATDNSLGFATYKDIPSNGCYDNTIGHIAGSLVGLEGMYELKLTGRAYIRCNDYIFYADNVWVRTVKEVAQKALDDLLYQKDGAYFKYENNGYVAYEGEKSAKYTEIVTEQNSDGYKVLSRYTKSEREDVLADFAK